MKRVEAQPIVWLAAVTVEAAAVVAALAKGAAAEAAAMGLGMPVCLSGEVYCDKSHSGEAYWECCGEAPSGEANCGEA